jgi:hypothetical protein
VKPPIDSDADGVFTSTDAPCSHGVWHRLRVRASTGGDWVGGMAAYQESGTDELAMIGAPIVYSAPTKAAALAEGKRRLKNGGCGCQAPRKLN